MKSGTQDQAEGVFHKILGKLKEIAWEAIDNPELETEGTGEKIAGNVQEKIGQIKKVWESSESGVSRSGVFLGPRTKRVLIIEP